MCSDAIQHGNQDVARVLVEAGAKHGSGTNFALDLVHAAGKGDLKTVQKLVDNGIPVTSSDYDLRTPLHVAIAGRHVDVIRYLLDRGADLNVEDRHVSLFFYILFFLFHFIIFILFFPALFCM